MSEDAELTPVGVSVYAERELGFPLATGPLHAIAGLRGEWGALHVKRGDGSHWTLVSRDVELHRSLRATAIDERELSDALSAAVAKHDYKWQLAGWPEEWQWLWPKLQEGGAPIKYELIDDEEFDAGRPPRGVD